MKWKLEFSEKADKQLEKIDNSVRKIIVSWLLKNINDCDNPRKFGKALKGNFTGQWRYTIGDYRVLCYINDKKLVVLAITVGHRSKIYK